MAKLLDFRDSGHLPSDMFTFASISDIFLFLLFFLFLVFFPSQTSKKYTRTANKSPEYLRNVTTDYTQQYHTAHRSRMSVNGQSQEVIPPSYRKLSLLSYRENFELLGMPTVLIVSNKV